MLKKLNYISIFILILISISCKNEKKNDGLNSSPESELITDSINAYNELANPDKKETFTISEYNTDNPEIENIKQQSAIGGHFSFLAVFWRWLL